MKIFKNDVLVLQLDNYGILKKKDLQKLGKQNFDYLTLRLRNLLKYLEGNLNLLNTNTCQK